MDTTRDKNNLGDYYQEMKNIPPLLICNQNSNKPRLSKQVLRSSVLLQNANIDLGECYSLTSRNFNDTIYERNMPFNRETNYWAPTISPSPSVDENNISNNNISNNNIYNQTEIIPENNLPLKIETRPLLSGLCPNEKAIKERNELDKFNEYKPNNSGNRCDMVYVPGKGPINHYFDNIDVESQLKNINEIDTKCSMQLFKINPNEKTNKLYCYKDNLVKDYQRRDSKTGYTWCDYVDGIKYDQFPICQSQEFTCALSKGSRKPEKVEPRQEQQSGKMIEERDLNRVTRELYLVRRKRELDEQIGELRNRQNLGLQNKHISQIRPNGINNIIAPTIIKQKVDEEVAKLLGERARVEGILQKITKTGLRNTKPPLEQLNGKKILNQECVTPVTESNLAKFICRGQTKDLYRFKNIMGNQTDDCYYCEQIFNNMTKRKNIVPNDSRFK